MTELEVRLREDLPRLAVLLADSAVVPRTESFDAPSGAPRRWIGRRRVRQTALVLCGAALVIAVVTVFAVTRTTPHVSAPASPTPQVSTPSAPDGGLSDSQVNPGPIPPGSFLYVRTTGFTTGTTTASGGTTYTVVVPTTQESWIGADRSGRLRITHGDTKFLTPENEKVARDAGLNETSALQRLADRDELLNAGKMDYFDLSQLPTDDASLRARLNQAADLDPSSPADPAHLLETVSDWGWPWARAPITIRKGLVSVLSSTPGMITESQGEMTVVAADRDGIRGELWFDNTGELRRSRRVVTDATIPSALHAPNGTVLQDVTLEVATLVPSTSDSG